MLDTDTRYQPEIAADLEGARALNLFADLLGSMYRRAPSLNNLSASPAGMQALQEIWPGLEMTIGELQAKAREIEEAARR